MTEYSKALADFMNYHLKEISFQMTRTLVYFSVYNGIAHFFLRTGHINVDNAAF